MNFIHGIMHASNYPIRVLKTKQCLYCEKIKEEKELAKFKDIESAQNFIDKNK
jgi:hypothetical protein